MSVLAKWVSNCFARMGEWGICGNENGGFAGLRRVAVMKVDENLEGKIF